MVLSGAPLGVISFSLWLVIERGKSVDHPFLGVNNSCHLYLPKVLLTLEIDPTDLLLPLNMLATQITLV